MPLSEILILCRCVGVVFLLSCTGRDMVEYLEHGLSFHVAQELKCHEDDATILERLERAFLMADIHSKQLGITTSGATVAVCLVQVSEACVKGNGYEHANDHQLETTNSLHLTMQHPVNWK